MQYPEGVWTECCLHKLHHFHHGILWLHCTLWQLSSCLDDLNTSCSGILWLHTAPLVSWWNILFCRVWDLHLPRGHTRGDHRKPNLCGYKLWFHLWHTGMNNLCGCRLRIGTRVFCMMTDNHEDPGNLWWSSHWSTLQCWHKFFGHQVDIGIEQVCWYK